MVAALLREEIGYRVPISGRGRADAAEVWARLTKQTHPSERELYKACSHAVAYGMEAQRLAHRIGQPVIAERDLLRAHHETYRKFWTCSPLSIMPS
jgi:DNA polymerase I-like protein with 3'-5' exonuclease and polymerase domains